jgi:hypothetical protein
MEGPPARAEIDVRCCRATRRRPEIEPSIRRIDRRRIIREWALHRQDGIFGTDITDRLSVSRKWGKIIWNGTQLAFSITIGAGANNLYAMGPNQMPGSHRGSLTINGSGLTSWSRRSYAVFRAAKGTAVATYIP